MSPKLFQRIEGPLNSLLGVASRPFHQLAWQCVLSSSHRPEWTSQASVVIIGALFPWNGAVLVSQVDRIPHWFLLPNAVCAPLLIFVGLGWEIPVWGREFCSGSISLASQLLHIHDGAHPVYTSAPPGFFCASWLYYFRSATFQLVSQVDCSVVFRINTSPGLGASGWELPATVEPPWNYLLFLKNNLLKITNILRRCVLGWQTLGLLNRNSHHWCSLSPSLADFS